MWNKKKLTIPCDKCGARLENIPEKCPHCGEIITGWTDPLTHERIEVTSTGRPFGKIHAALLSILGFCLFANGIYISNDANTNIVGYILLVFPGVLAFSAAISCISGRYFPQKKPGGILILQYMIFTCLAIQMFAFSYHIMSKPDPRFVSPVAPEVETFLTVAQIAGLIIFPFFILAFVTAVKKPRNIGWLILLPLELIFFYGISYLIGLFIAMENFWSIFNNFRLL